MLSILHSVLNHKKIYISFFGQDIEKIDILNGSFVMPLIQIATENYSNWYEYLVSHIITSAIIAENNSWCVC